MLSFFQIKYLYEAKTAFYFKRSVFSDEGQSKMTHVLVKAMSQYTVKKYHYHNQSWGQNPFPTTHFPPFIYLLFLSDYVFPGAYKTVAQSRSLSGVTDRI